MNAVGALLEHGLCDPRGGTFSRVSIEVGDAAWERGARRAAFGWVVKNGKQVVAVDGLRYDVVEVLGPARISELYARDQRAFSAVPVDQPNIALPALLLVRGQVSLAEECYRQFAGIINPPLNLYVHFIDRYRMQVAQCLIDRRDRDALPWARRLLEVSELREAANQNYPKDVGWRLDPEEPRQIMADIERRSKLKKAQPDLEAIAKLEPEKRIAALIGTLDEVDARQMGQPGGIEWTGAAIIRALVREGEAAVPGLLDAIGNDKRLTRAVGFARDFSPRRTIGTVKTAATRALLTIWPSAQSFVDEQQELKLGELRKQWEKVAGLSPPERWLLVLSDDSVKPTAWLAAALALTSTQDPRTPNVMAGEPLRKSQGREISELLRRRTRQMTDVEQVNSSFDLFAFSDGLRASLCLGRWEPSAALPTMKVACHDALRLLKSFKQEDLADRFILPWFGSLVVRRMKLGDATAIDDQREVAQSVPFDGSSKELFRPVWTFRDSVEVDAFARELYVKLTARMRSQDARIANGAVRYVKDLIHSPLVKSAEFREFLARSTELRESGGWVWLELYQGNRYLRYEGLAGASGSGGPVPGPFDRFNLERSPISIGDDIASAASTYEAAPNCSFVLKRALLDAAKAELRKWLRDDRVNWDQVASKVSFYWDPDPEPG